MQSGNIGLQC